MSLITADFSKSLRTLRCRCSAQYSLIVDQKQLHHQFESSSSEVAKHIHKNVHLKTPLQGFTQKHVHSLPPRAKSAGQDETC